MRALILTFAVVVAAPQVANAHTLCVNRIKEHGGMNFYAVPGDICPTKMGEEFGRFRYSRVKNTDKCLFESPRTRSNGDQLVCTSNLTIQQISEIQENSSLLKHNPLLRQWIIRMGGGKFSKQWINRGKSLEMPDAYEKLEETAIGNR